jgi:hypothetical protein
MNQPKQIIFYLILLAVASCSKSSVDMRIISRPSAAYKSFIPNLNEQFQKVRITDLFPPFTQTTFTGYYRTSNTLYKTNTPCPNGYDCTYTESYFLSFINPDLYGSYSIYASPDKVDITPYLSVYSLAEFKIFLKSDFSDYDYTRVSKIGDYSLNGKQYREVVKVNNNQGYSLYYSKYAGIIQIIAQNKTLYEIL